MTEIKNFDGDISVGRHAVVGGDAKVCGGMTVGKNLKVEGWLDAKNLKAANKGVFLNEESLKKAYPVPKDGWWALVGDTLPAALWVAADGEWGNTGGTGGDILLESEVLADIKERLARAQEGVDAATTKNAEQDSRLANAEEQNTKQNERLLNYVYPKLYQLNEGAGSRPFDGMYSGSASVLDGRKTVAEEGYTYKVVFALGKFLLQEISPSGVTIGLYEEWDKITSDRDSSEDYTRRDCLYYVYTEGEGSYYYYIDADGNISEQAGTYLLRKLIDDTNAKITGVESTANSAKSTAADAKMNATLAMNTARSASLNATAASGTANEAKAKAEAAKTESAQAVSTAQEAKDTAGAAKEIADAAKAAADLAKTESAQAGRTAQAAQNKNAEQDNRLANAEEQNTKQNERLLNYVYPKLYQLNEGAGSRPFDGMYSGSASVLDGRKTVAVDGCTYKVVFSSGKFLLLEINQDGEDAGLYEAWDKIISGRGSSEDYTRRDCLYYIYVSGEGSTYYYIDSKGNATEQSATYLLRRLVDKNTAAIAALQGNVVGPGGDTSEGVSQIKELGEFDTFAALLAQAANFYIVSNNAIALLHGTYKQAESIYNGVLILQQVEKNNEGGGTAMQYIYSKKQQFTRSIAFSATAVTAVQLPQNYGARNLSLSGRVLQMTNMWGDNVGDSATLPDNGNIYEGEAGASSVPVVLAKTFGGTVNATLGAATSARAGVMTVDHVNKISKLEERVLQYIYPKIYQLNEGAGARPFDGIYDGNASVSTDRKEAVEEGCTYKVVFKLGSFYLQEISPGGTTVCLYSGWDKIISARGSSEDYTRRDCLYYVYTEGEGSYYYYIDADGNISEQAGTYLLRKLIDDTKSKIASVESAATVAQELLDEVREAMITTISVDGDAEGVNLKVENELTHAGISMKIPNADVRRNKAGVVTGTEINALYEIDFAAADVTNIGFEKDAEKNKITLTGIGQLGSCQDGGIELTPATSELAGLMSAADKAKFETVDWQELLAYGISFNSKDAEPDCTRIGNPSLHRTLPIQSKMRGGTLLPGGEFTPFENVDDWTSEVRDGSAGDVMVEIPEHYIKFVSKGTIEKGQSREIWLSEYPLPGFKLVPKVYVSAYECAMYCPGGVSTSDYRIRSVVNLTADYRGGDGNPSYDEDATASRLGTAFPANRYATLRVNPVKGFSFYDYAVHKSIYWLMCVEYGTRNIHKDFIEYRDVNGYMQGGLGATSIYAKVVKVGVSDTYGNRSGVVSTTSVDGATIKVPRYRGIEFPFGNYCKELKGIAFAVAGGGSTNVYVTKDGRAAVGADEADGTHNEFGNQEEWNLIGTITSSKQVLAYISDILFVNHLFGDSGDIIPISIEGGGSGKYYCEQTVFYSPNAVGNLTAVGVYGNGLLDIRINAGGALSSNTSCRRIIYYPNKQNKS